jgi:hypothetical protein
MMLARHNIRMLHPGIRLPFLHLPSLIAHDAASLRRAAIQRGPIPPSCAACMHSYHAESAAEILSARIDSCWPNEPNGEYFIHTEWFCRTASH